MPDPEVPEVLVLDAGERIGLIGDIHGNPFALAAVLAAGRAAHVTRWLVLGDVVAMGPDPNVVLELLDAVDVVATISGNTERYVLDDDLPDPTFDDVAQDPSLLPRLAEIAGTFGWTKGFLAAAGRTDTIRDYSPQFRMKLPDGTCVLAVHASMVSDEGEGITPTLAGPDVERLFPDHRADLIVGGHTHQRTDLVLDGVRFINPGSVSNHHAPDLPATFSILDVGPSSHSFSHHDVSYDKSEAIRAIRRSGIPGSEFLVGRYFEPDA